MGCQPARDMARDSIGIFKRCEVASVLNEVKLGIRNAIGDLQLRLERTNLFASASQHQCWLSDGCQSWLAIAPVY